MKRIVMILSAMLITSTFVFAQAKKAAPALPVTGKLTVEVFDRGSDGGRTPAHNNAWTNWIKEKVKKDLNIDVTFVPVGRWSENQDIVNLMAAGSAPDLCYTYNMDMINEFRDKGGIFEVSGYVDSYLPDFKKLLGADPSFPGKNFIYRNQDPKTQNIYSFAAYRTAIAQRNIFIRKDWLDKLNIKPESIKNINQFYQVLKTFRDKDPGNVGKNKVIPLGVNKDARWGLADFINNYLDPKMTDRDRWINSIADRYITMKGFRNGVKEMNKWYNEGLIFKDFPLMTTTDDFNNLVKSGVVGAVCQNWDWPYRTDMNILVDLRKNVPNADFIPLSITLNKSVMDKNGVYIFIPNSSPNKDAALKYLNWLAKPENYSYLQLGQEGVNHKMVNGIPQTQNMPAKHVWFMNSPNNIDLTMPMNGVELGSDEKNAKVLSFSYGTFSPDVISNAYLTSIKGARGPAVWQATTKVNQYSADLQNKADDLLAKAITANSSDFDKVWDSGYSDWLKSGGQEVLDERTSLYPPK